MDTPASRIVAVGAELGGSFLSSSVVGESLGAAASMRGEEKKQRGFACTDRLCSF